MILPVTRAYAIAAGADLEGMISDAGRHPCREVAEQSRKIQERARRFLRVGKDRPGVPSCENRWQYPWPG